PTQEHALEDTLIDLRDLQSADAQEPDADDRDAGDRDAEEPAADAPGEVVTSGARTTAVQDTLTAAVPTADLADGAHTLTVVATDLAGGTATETLDFQIAPPAEEIEISGPASVELSIHREELGDQAALAETVLDSCTVTLDGDARAAEEAGIGLRLAPVTVLVEGEHDVIALEVDYSGEHLIDDAGVSYAISCI